MDFHKFYDKKFYKKYRVNEKFFYSAKKILPVVINAIPCIESAVDVGCGTGLWLSVLQEETKIKRVKGIDGKWVDKKLLEITKEEFVESDLSKTFPIFDEKFDLAISLEVAEHLPPERALAFIDYLTSLSDFVLFSAAIPFQGGINHFNEQWQDYWADLFEKRNYVPFDIIRSKVWNDEKINNCLKQNTILYVKKNEIHRVKIEYIPREKLILSIVHPSYASPSTKKILWKGLLRSALQKSAKRIWDKFIK